MLGLSSLTYVNRALRGSDDDLANVETQPDPQDLYRSKIKSDTPQHMAKFTGPGGAVDLDIAIRKMLVLATSVVPAAKS
jgi:hypothetical protein